MRILDRGRTCTPAAIIATWVSLVSPVHAAPVFVGGGGLEYYEAAGQRTRSAMAIVGAEADAGSVSLALLRYSDSYVGDGTGYVLGVGVPLAPAVALRTWGYRFVGDETLRSWRIKAGPLVEVVGGGSVGFYYSHAEDNAGLRSNGAAAELTTPFGPRFTGRAGAAYASASDGLQATQATVGLGFTPVHGLEFSAETGLARNAAFLTSSGPASGSLPGGIGVGDSGAGSEASRMDPVFLLGVRVLLP